VVREGRSDAQLLRATSNDSTAFVAFYDRYEAAVVGYLRRSVHDPEVVADLTAEVFAAVLCAAPRYRESHPTAAGWLFTIARNTLQHSLRRSRVEAKARLRLGIRDAVSFTDDELDRVDALASGSSPILTLLEQLPRDQADAIRARVLDDRPYPEIAAELQTSELVIRKRVSRGLATLRGELEKKEKRS
jgi:RNA polymerase sigma-70 factor (ECF subfamily)